MSGVESLWDVHFYIEQSDEEHLGIVDPIDIDAIPEVLLIDNDDDALIEEIVTQVEPIVQPIISNIQAQRTKKLVTKPRSKKKKTLLKLVDEEDVEQIQVEFQVLEPRQVQVPERVQDQEQVYKGKRKKESTTRKNTDVGGSTVGEGVEDMGRNTVDGEHRGGVGDMGINTDNWAKLDPDNLNPKEGYYSTHTSQDGDDGPTQENIDKYDLEFRDLAKEYDNIFIEEEDTVHSIPPQPTYGLVLVPIAQTHIDKLKRQYSQYRQRCFVSEYHKVSSYVKTYKDVIYHVVNPSEWGQPQPPYFLPPPLVRGPRRPRKERIHDPDEKRPHKRCGTYGCFGHNKTTCKGPPVVPTPRVEVNEIQVELEVDGGLEEIQWEEGLVQGEVEIKEKLEVEGGLEEIQWEEELEKRMLKAELVQREVELGVEQSKIFKLQDSQKVLLKYLLLKLQGIHKVRGGTKRPRSDDTGIHDGQRVGDNPVYWATDKGFRDRPIVKEQIVDIKSIFEVNAGYTRVFTKFRGRNWTKILTPSGKVYPRIVRLLYATLELEHPAATYEGEFEEDGVPILPAPPDMAIDITTQHRLYTGSGIISRKMLDDESRLVHSIAIVNIIPRSQKNELSKRMKVFLYVFKNDIELDLPNIIIEEMIDASTKTATRSSLPFARLVMVILTVVGYKVFPNEPEDTKTEKLDASNCHKSTSHLPPVLRSEPAPPGEHIGSSSSVTQPQEVFSLQSIGSMLQTVSTRLGAIEGRLETMEGRLETIETDVRGLRQVQEPHEFEYDSGSGDA
ncbi:hypothetical protein GIB67_001259 [Kingdonia uniflora]|uniref:Uncharacterized protein n=1 Tax=Kingdonia uniflora TaxID=39325 RepID=A0A7J7LHJ7_9MAGN|nr:hypothetical protein GIB67_001259 [Kingdonia uniflora]